MNTMTVVLDEDVADWVRGLEPSKRHWSRQVNKVLRTQMAGASKNIPTSGKTHYSGDLVGLMAMFYDYRNLEWPDGRPVFDSFEYGFVADHQDGTFEMTDRRRRLIERMRNKVRMYFDRYGYPDNDNDDDNHSA